MKKHYRGKRHMHARSTVRVGRDKKRARKYNRMLRMLKKKCPDFIIMAQNIEDLISGLVSSMVRIGSVFANYETND